VQKDAYNKRDAEKSLVACLPSASRGTSGNYGGSGGGAAAPESAAGGAGGGSSGGGQRLITEIFPMGRKYSREIMNRVNQKLVRWVSTSGVPFAILDPVIEPLANWTLVKTKSPNR